MTAAADTDLYTRGAATVLASWQEIARGSAGAAVQRLTGVAAAVFPAGPERAIYNNAWLDRDLDPAERVAAVDAMEAAYRDAGVDRYAAWAHERDAGLRAELGRRGYAVQETTRAMGMALDERAVAPGEVELAPADWGEYLHYLHAFDVPAGLLGRVAPGAFRVVSARIGGETVATALAFDHHGDCGIFNLSTREPARRRGIGTALTARLLVDAAERGCATASLQATPMAERIYAAVGFRDLGRILEYGPPRR